MLVFVCLATGCRVLLFLIVMIAEHKFIDSFVIQFLNVSIRTVV